MSLKIEILSGPLKGKHIKLAFGIHTVGRGVGPLPLQDMGLSHEHAKLHVFSHRFEIEDLNSSNGTFLNETSVTKAPLKPGDVVRLGPESMFRILGEDRDLLESVPPLVTEERLSQTDISLNDAPKINLRLRKPNSPFITYRNHAQQRLKILKWFWRSTVLVVASILATLIWWLLTTRL